LVSRHGDGVFAALTTLAETVLLDHPSATTTDASASHSCILGSAGGLLFFFSQKLSAMEQRYSALDPELLPVLNSIVHFRHTLEVSHFTVFTDHQLLQGTLSRGQNIL
jgi:hypothetical protein